MARRNRATQRKSAPPIDPEMSVMAYFFEKTETPDGKPALKLKRDIVRRDELWGAFEWYHRKVTKQNAWYRQLWRALRGTVLVKFNPFRLARARGLDEANVLEQEKPLDLEQREAPIAKAKFDAEGRVVPA